MFDAADDSVAVTMRGGVSLQLGIAPSTTSAWRERNQTAVIVVDVRHSRPFDGSLPPLIEEQALQLVKKALESCIRSSDLVTRTADRQFSVLLNRVTGPEGVSRAFGRIVQSLECR
jgi:GGDEF domain-containing protein